MLGLLDNNHKIPYCYELYAIYVYDIGYNNYLPLGSIFKVVAFTEDEGFFPYAVRISDKDGVIEQPHFIQQFDYIITCLN